MHLPHSAFASIAFTVALTASGAFGTPCVVPDDGTGTAELPPQCADGYVGFMQISTGLPAGSTIDIDVRWHDSFNEIEVAGGPLGGHRQIFDGILEMTMAGTGALAGFNRLIHIQAACETHSGPRTPDLPVQSFAADVFAIDAPLFGDPDFTTLHVRAGSVFGMPGPGHTILTEQGPNFNVDSFFDVHYTIEFQGAPGSLLEGFAGTTERIDEFRAGEPVGMPGIPCLEPDNGFGTVDLPPLCPPGYAGHVALIDGLPANTTIEIEAILGQFFNRSEIPGGGLGGHLQQFDGVFTMTMSGTGLLGGFNRIIPMSVSCETYSAPRTPFDPVQSFDQEFWSVTGTVVADPDFDSITLTGGSFIGTESPGHTTLTGQPTGGWAVDSFFDICHDLQFVGAPGSLLEGLSGTTTDCSLFYLGILPTGSPRSTRAASSLELLPVRPNPARSGTEVTFRMPGAGGPVTLRVHDVSGRLVRTLLDGYVTGGARSARWDRRNESGALVAPGMYFYRLETAHGVRMRKGTLLR